MFRFRWWRYGAALFFGWTLSATPPLTTVQDVLYSSDGSRFSGLLTISWPSFEASDTSNIAAQTMRIEINNGILFVQLVPTTNADTPAVYTVQYNSNNGTLYTEAWAVPASTAPVRVRDVRLAPGTVSGSAPTPSSPPTSGASLTGSTSGIGSNASSGSGIQISDVNGLQAALNARPTEGAAFTISRAAVINVSGSIDGATGNLSDCMHVDGTSGACGTGAGSTVTFIDSETPTGTVNGTNTVFALANAPNPSASLAVFRNGLLMEANADYTLSGNAVTFLSTSIPQTGDQILASYRLGGSVPNVGFVDSETPSGTLDGVNSAFTLSQVASPPSSVAVYRNGLRMSAGVDYSISGSTLSFLNGQTPQAGDILLCFYRIAQ
jgi:hypothetical protein